MVLEETSLAGLCSSHFITNHETVQGSCCLLWYLCGNIKEVPLSQEKSFQLSRLCTSQ